MAHYLVKRKIESLLEDNSIESKLQSLTKNDLISHLSKIETNIETNDGSPWIACSDYFTQRYLNLDDVKTALNVNASYDWAECSDAVFYAWPNKDWDNGMETVYHTLVDDYNIRMMIYSGDDDSVCGLQGTMYWLTRMGWVEDEDNSWEAWSVAKQLGGFYTRFLTTDGDVALHFQTIRSAGHMVPGTQPERAQELLYKFLYELEDD